MPDHLQGLPPDVLLNIIDELMNQPTYLSNSSLLRLARISKTFCQLATPIIYRNVKIDDDFIEMVFSRGDFWFHQAPDRSRASYSSLSHFFTYTQKIHIDDSLSTQHGYTCSFLESLVRMKKLRAIEWSFKPINYNQTIIDDVVYKLLLENPHITIDVFHLPLVDLKLIGTQFRLEIENDLRRLHHLSRCCSAIRQLKVTVGSEVPEIMSRLTVLLLTLQKLEVLEIVVPAVDHKSGSDQPPGDEILSRFGINNNFKLAPLKKLVYRRYYKLSHTAFRFSQFSSTYFDWSRIENLTLSGFDMIDFVSSTKGHIKRLKTLKIENFCLYTDYEEGGDVLNQFLSEISGIVSLHLCNAAKNVPISVLCRYGASLRRLYMRQPRRMNWAEHSYLSATDCLSNDELLALRESCPNLSELCLELPINRQDAYRFLATLAQFTKLKTLYLYIQTVRPDPQYREAHQSRWVFPKVSFASDEREVRNMFLFILRLRKGRQFQSFQIIRGEFFLQPQNPLDDFIRPLITTNFMVRSSGLLAMSGLLSTSLDTSQNFNTESDEEPDSFTN